MGRYGELVVKEDNITMGAIALPHMEWSNNLPVNGYLQVLVLLDLEKKNRIFVGL